MCATFKVDNVCSPLKKHFFSSPWIGFYLTHFTASVPTCTIASISSVARTTCAIKGPLSVNTVSIHGAIMVAIGAFINIYITYRMIIDQIIWTRGDYFFTDLAILWILINRCRLLLAEAGLKKEYLSFWSDYDKFDLFKQWQNKNKDSKPKPVLGNYTMSHRKLKSRSQTDNQEEGETTYAFGTLDDNYFLNFSLKFPYILSCLLCRNM